MNDVPPGLVAIVVALISIVGSGGYFAQRNKNKIDLFAQYQKDREIDRDNYEDDRNTDRARIAVLEVRVEALLARERVLEEYAYDLRRRISDGVPPPPPPWPIFS